MTPIKSALNPVFVHPSRQVLHNPTKKPDPEPVLPFDGIVVERLEERRSCLAGKKPLPRRSMIAAGPSKTEYIFRFWWGFNRFRKGLQIRWLLGDNLNADAKRSITGNMKLDAVTFGDTFLFHDLKSLGPEKLCGFGIKDGECLVAFLTCTDSAG